MTREQKKALSILFLVVATELVGFGLIIPVLPQIALTFETNPFSIGVLMASYSLAQFIAAPLLGGLSDKIGRRPVLIFSKLGTVFAYVLLAFSQHYWLLLAARLLDGFTGGNISVARAYVTDVTNKEDRSKGMAVIGMGFGFGFIVGPALGGFLYGSSTGHFIPSLVAGGMSFVAMLLTIFLLKEPEKKETFSSSVSLIKSNYKVLAVPVVGIICGLFLVYMMVFSGFETTFALFTNLLFGFTAKQNSWLFMFAGFVSLFVQGGIARRKVTRLKSVCVLGFLLFAVAFFGLSNASSLYVLLSFLALLAFGIGFLNSYLPSMLSVYTPQNKQGYIMGLFDGIGSLSRVLGPLVAYSFVINDPRAGYFIYGLLMFVAAGFLAFSLKNKP